jgi:hypothetical protein
VALTLISGVPTGITIVARTPKRLATKATPCAWLPALAAITPHARCGSASVASLLNAPRSLNDPVICRFSSLR